MLLIQYVGRFSSTKINSARHKFQSPKAICGRCRDLPQGRNGPGRTECEQDGALSKDEDIYGQPDAVAECLGLKRPAAKLWRSSLSGKVYS